MYWKIWILDTSKQIWIVVFLELCVTQTVSLELTPGRGWRGHWWPWRSGSPASWGCRSMPHGHSRRKGPHPRSRGWSPPGKRRAPRPDTWCNTRNILQRKMTKVVQLWSPSVQLLPYCFTAVETNDSLRKEFALAEISGKSQLRLKNQHKSL